MEERGRRGFTSAQASPEYPLLSIMISPRSAGTEVIAEVLESTKVGGREGLENATIP